MSKLEYVSLFQIFSVMFCFAKYYLTWFTAGKVITEINRVNILLRHSVDRASESRIVTVVICNCTTRNVLR